MRKNLFLVLALLLAAAILASAARKHTIVLGKWMPVKLFVGPNEDRTLDIRIRPLYVDGQLREFTTGDPYDVTDRHMVVQRAYRLNDWLPQDKGPTQHRFLWQRGGWLLVDRETGRVAPLRLPRFDPFYSIASWYRDYVAYCGLSDDGEKLYAMVVQLNRKKPLVEKELRPARQGEMPNSECAPPVWQRGPVRISFEPAGSQKITFSIRSYGSDLLPEPDADAEVRQEP